MRAAMEEGGRVARVVVMAAAVRDMVLPTERMPPPPSPLPRYGTKDGHGRPVVLVCM